MQFELSDIKLCIFDLDGTLVNSNEAEIPFFFTSLSQLLNEKLDSDISNYPHRTFSSVLNNTVPLSKREEVFHQLDDIMMSFVQKQTWSSLSKGTGLLNLVLNSSMEYYIVTGNFKTPSLEKASRAGIALPLEHVYSTGLGDDSKAQVIEKLIAQNQCLPHQVLSIGDSSYDEAIAKQLGLHFIWA
ncbi:HAD family hydrolase [Photobacterium sp. SDRW27]|uniref:HAD family hydrolase n=1 Tax=Photobacterium obscurum TaxID=2829490 RepID=UPI00224413B1|nr:HAD hydrolase-like protein [Photobacterium obscurum]MCW8329856.1 HAD family hydrolase [Photobacterium obscurum]